MSSLPRLTFSLGLSTGPDDRCEIRSGPSTIRFGQEQARNTTTGLSYSPEKADGKSLLKWWVDTKCYAYEATLRKQPLMAQAIAIGFTSLILTNMYEVSRQAGAAGSLSTMVHADRQLYWTARNSPRH